METPGRGAGGAARAVTPREGVQQGGENVLPRTPTRSRLGGEQQGDAAPVSLLGLT